VVPHCLLVTHVPLSRLSERNNGTYHRLALLADAIRRTHARVRICCTVPADRPVAETCTAIVREVQDAWGIDADVVATPVRHETSRAWILQELLAATDYGRTPYVRDRVTPDFLRLLAGEIDRKPAFVLGHRLPAMFALASLERPLPPTFFDLDDVEHIVAKRRAIRAASGRRRLLGLAAIPALVRAERRAMRAATRTLVCSPDDAREVSDMAGSETVVVIPNAVRIADAPLPIVPRRSMAMVGAYDFDPNADGADFFVREVWPLVRAQLPDATVTFVGAAPAHARSSSSPPAGVTFSGFVQDIDSVYRTTRVIICPVRYGAGTRVKLVEAAGLGKPIVSTTVGAEGLGMRSGVHALLADTAAAFAEACVTLLRDDVTAAALAQQAHRLAREAFDANRVAEDLSNQFRKFTAPS
jgi:hypothetical protein